MSVSTRVGRGGVGLGGAAFLVLLTLKIAQLSDISWFWVFFPLWAGLGFVVGVVFAALLIYGAVMVASALANAANQRLRRKAKPQ